MSVIDLFYCLRSSGRLCKNSRWSTVSGFSCRYPSGNTAPTLLPQMHYRYRGSTVHSVPSPRYYREILPIPTVITAVTAVLPHSQLPCHSLLYTVWHIPNILQLTVCYYAECLSCLCAAIMANINLYIIIIYIYNQHTAKKLLGTT